MKAPLRPGTRPVDAAHLHLLTYEIRAARVRAFLRARCVGCSLGRGMRSSVLYLVFNFGASVLIIFVNKSLFSGGLRFESACTLNSG